MPDLVPPPCPQALQDLVARFAAREAEYKSTSYKEKEVRSEFIEPFFKILGWDVNNERGESLVDKDVVHEYSLSVSGSARAPDYCFRLGGRRQFFLEAKAPHVNLANDPAPALQVRRYGWNAKLPLSVLTDFEELVIYDTRVKPKANDKPDVAEKRRFHYKDYVRRWDVIWRVFSREAVAAGSFDREAASKKRKDSVEVDVDILRTIEDWRLALARNIALRNPDTTQAEVNFAVQMLIDRILFLRICEDRGIEQEGYLRRVANDSNPRSRLNHIFELADQRYNSGLFHFGAERGRASIRDTISPKIEYDDKLLKEIIGSLYWPRCPYQFNVLPPEILGHVYEQFLGKVIRLTPGHRAQVDEKPEVRKAGGVFYTPSFIVDYMIRTTLGPLLEGQTPDQIEEIRILDPACGSGSFLIGAYQFLLDWYQRQYEGMGVRKRKAFLHETPDGWILRAETRRAILLRHIFGVDIDAQAVEVTKLSLLLKVLEKTSGETLEANQKLFHERALPDLDSNIKCGNSLVDPTILRGRLEWPQDEVTRLNPFDWQGEFDSIMAAGGFDVVVGNPPYIFGEYHDDLSKAFIKQRYKTAIGQYDTYWLFIERSLNLVRTGGGFSMIVPDALLARDEAAAVRELLLDHGLETVFHCGQVFEGAGVSAVVVRTRPPVNSAEIDSLVLHGTDAVLEHRCSRSRFSLDTRKRLLVHSSDQEWALVEKLERSSSPLGSQVAISRGEEQGKKNLKEEGPIPILVGSDISPYHISPATRYVDELQKDSTIYRPPKVLVVKTGQYPIAAVDAQGIATLQSVYNLHCTEEALLPHVVAGLLNSSVARFHVRKTFTDYKQLFPQMNQSTLASIPVPATALHAGNPTVNKVAQVAQLLADLNDKLVSVQVPNERRAIERRIAAEVEELDRIIGGLYGLSQDELKTVHNALAR